MISRVGLLLESLIQPAWVYATIQRLTNDAGVSIALVVLAEGRAAPATLGTRLRRVAEYGLLEAFEKLDELMFARPPDPFATHEALPLLEGVPMIATELHPGPGGRGLPAQDLDAIRSAHLDALLYFGEDTLFSGGIRSSAQQGLWFFRIGSPPPYEGARSGFWEALAGEMTATAALLAVSDRGMEELSKSVTAVDPVSAARTRDTVYWTSTSLPERALKRIRAGKGTDQPARPVPPIRPDMDPWTPDTPAEGANRRLVRHLPRYLALVGRKSLRSYLGDVQWFLTYTWADQGIVPSLRGSQRIVPPPDRFWADPQVVRRGDQYFVFVEELVYSEKRGRIAVLVLDKSGVVDGPLTVLERPYHLSYPFVFEHEDALYMVPETSEHRTVELYRCVEFPTRWEFVRELMENVTAFDTTLCLHNERWWLFTAICETHGADRDSELYLFSCEDPVNGEWRPHSGNPVVADARTARPAGRIFEQDGKLLRPSQQTVPEYGYAIHVNEIVAMTDEEYAESPIGLLLPDWEDSLIGTHTLSRADDLTIVDAYRWRPRFARGRSGSDRTV